MSTTFPRYHDYFLGNDNYPVRIAVNTNTLVPSESLDIMLVSVTERTREIGIRKAIGAKRRTILGQFLVEALMLSLAGAVIGVLIGGGGSVAVGALMQARGGISLASVLLAVGFALAIGIIFGVYPARKAANLNPIDALRYE